MSNADVRWTFINDIPSDTKGTIIFTMALGLAVAVAGSAIAWPVCWYKKSVAEAMIENGYEEVPNPADRNSTLWQKVKR